MTTNRPFMQPSDLLSAYTAILLTFAIVVGPAQIAAAAPASIGQAIEQSSDRSEFEAPTNQQLASFHEVALSTLDAELPIEVLRERWELIGWTLDEMSVNDSRIWILHDVSSSKRGAGLFAVRPDSPNHILLQCPHSFFDKFTRPIGIRMFERSDLRAAAWNTVHRRVHDVAHSEHSYFHAFTRAFIASAQRSTSPFEPNQKRHQLDRSVPSENTNLNLSKTSTSGSRPIVVQLHGFSQEARKTRSGLQAEVIVSNGTRFPPRWLRSVAIDLSEISQGVRLFPTEVNELGATTNSQALLAAEQQMAFLHIELSSPIRQKLRRKNDLLDKLSDSILSANRDR